jgi:hypothetical protein
MGKRHRNGSLSSDDDDGRRAYSQHQQLAAVAQSRRDSTSSLTVSRSQSNRIEHVTTNATISQNEGLFREPIASEVANPPWINNSRIGEAVSDLDLYSSLLQRIITNSQENADSFQGQYPNNSMVANTGPTQTPINRQDTSNNMTNSILQLLQMQQLASNQTQPLQASPPPIQLPQVPQYLQSNNSSNTFGNVPFIPPPINSDTSTQQAPLASPPPLESSNSSNAHIFKALLPTLLSVLCSGELSQQEASSLLHNIGVMTDVTSIPAPSAVAPPAPAVRQDTPWSLFSESMASVAGPLCTNAGSPQEVQASSQLQQLLMLLQQQQQQQSQDISHPPNMASIPQWNNNNSSSDGGSIQNSMSLPLSLNLPTSHLKSPPVPPQHPTVASEHSHSSYNPPRNVPLPLPVETVLPPHFAQLCHSTNAAATNNESPLQAFFALLANSSNTNNNNNSSNYNANTIPAPKDLDLRTTGSIPPEISVPHSASAQPPISMVWNNSSNPSPSKKMKKNDTHAHFDTTSLKKAPLESFPVKLHRLLLDVQDTPQQAIVSFTPSGSAFVVHEPMAFMSDIAPRYFNMTSMASFRRQLYLYDFVRTEEGSIFDAYSHPQFRQDRPELASQMKRNANKVPK